MDYSYYQNAPQAYQFLGMPPTPAHSGSAVSSEDYNNSPTVRAPFHYAAPVLSQTHLPHPQSEEFHQNPSPHYSHSHYHSSPSPQHQSPIQPGPQTQAFLTPRGQHDAFDQYQNFDFTQHFSSANQALPKSSPPLSQQKAALASNGNVSAMHSNYEVNNYESNNGAVMETASEESRRSVAQGQSNSDDDDMTPAQSRRKAQNRAA